MNNVNKQALKLYKVTEKDFIDWCKKNNKNITPIESKKEFFKLLQNKKLVKKGSKLIEKK